MGDRRGRLEAEHGVDPVARQRPDPLGARADLARPDGPPSFRHAGEAPRRLAEQVVAEVEDVDAQDHQVLAPAPPVFLAPPAELEHLADRPLGDQRLDPLVPRAVARLEGHRELDVRPLAGRRRSRRTRPGRGPAASRRRCRAPRARHTPGSCPCARRATAARPRRTAASRARASPGSRRRPARPPGASPPRRGPRRPRRRRRPPSASADPARRVEAVAVVSPPGPTDDRRAIRGSKHVDRLLSIVSRRPDPRACGSRRSNKFRYPGTPPPPRRPARL